MATTFFLSTCTAPRTCPCSECRTSQIPTTCPEGCPCIVCLVDSLGAFPPPRMDALYEPHDAHARF